MTAVLLEDVYLNNGKDGCSIRVDDNGFGLCVRCLCALARVSASNDARPVLPAVGDV